MLSERCWSHPGSSITRSTHNFLRRGGCKTNKRRAIFPRHTYGSFLTGYFVTMNTTSPKESTAPKLLRHFSSSTRNLALAPSLSLRPDRSTIAHFPNWHGMKRFFLITFQTPLTGVSCAGKKNFNAGGCKISPLICNGWLDTVIPAEVMKCEVWYSRVWRYSIVS